MENTELTNPEGNNTDPIKQLIIDIIDERYQGVSFSDEILDQIQEKVTPNIHSIAETGVVDFVSGFFNAKKVTRKPRKPKVSKVLESPSEDAQVKPATTSEPAPAKSGTAQPTDELPISVGT